MDEVAPGVFVAVPGHGHPGDGPEFRRRVAADFAYLDAVEAGRDPMTRDWRWTGCAGNTTASARSPAG